MPPKKHSAGEPSLKDLMAVMQQMSDQLTKVTNRANNLEDQLQSLRGEATAPAVKRSTPFYEGFDPNQRYFVRIKPYNKHLGHLRTRQYFDELGTTLKGGTGMPGDIPMWVGVSPQQAEALARHRQNPNNPNSPQVLDIVTEEEREIIDGNEQMHRMATLGVGGLPPSEIMGRMQNMSKASVQGGVQPPPPPATRERPSMIPGAERFAPRPTAVRAPVEQLRNTAVVTPTAPGRAAAMMDAPETNAEAHDFNAEDLDDSMILALSNAKQMAAMPPPSGESNVITGSLSPKR